jgi:lipoprotein-releasing system ATP-binding protein
MKREVILTGENIWKEYRTGNESILSVLKGVDVELKRGEFVVVVGPSGSGKSTLLHILGGLDHATSGYVRVDGRDLSILNEEALAAFRNQVMGFVFQFHHLLPEFSALENVCMPALISGKTIREVSRRGEMLLNQVGLSARIEHKPNALSGGEQQRVAVARALMNNPQLILADEPSGNLDEDNGFALHKLLVQLCEDFGITFIVATHNPDLTRRASRVLRLMEGKLHHERKL